jgi:nitrous oxidase accessory protein NosD
VPGDYDTIQDAVDDAENGDVIVVKSGTYPEAVSIGLLENITLKATGKVVIDGEGVRVPLSVGLCTNVTVSGFTIANSSGDVVVVGGAEGVVISKCRIDTGPGAGIRARSIRECRFEKCTFGGLGGDGIEIRDESGAPESMNCVVTKCRFTGSTGDGIYAGGSSHEITKNRIDQSAAAGIWVAGTDAVVEKNQVKGVAKYAIYVLGDRARVVKNKLTGPQSTAIWLGGDDSTIEKNVVKGTPGRGIDANGDGIQVLKNKVVATGDYGIDLDGNDCLLEKNKVTKCTTTAYRIRAGGNRIVKNKAAKCAGDVDDNVPAQNTYEKNSFGAPT